jgi:hypothetical protein
MTTEKTTTANNCIAKGGVSCLVETFVQSSKFELRMKFCGENRPQPLSNILKKMLFNYHSKSYKQ